MVLLCGSAAHPSSYADRYSGSPTGFLGYSLVPTGVFPPGRVAVSNGGSFAFFKVACQTSVRALEFGPSSVSVFSVCSASATRLCFLGGSFGLSYGTRLAGLPYPRIAEVLFTFFDFSVFSFRGTSRSSGREQSGFMASKDIFALGRLL